MKKKCLYYIYNIFQIKIICVEKFIQTVKRFFLKPAVKFICKFIKRVQISFRFKNIINVEGLYNITIESLIQEKKSISAFFFQLVL